MSVGDVLNPKRVRFQANERLDQIDPDAVSSSAREHLDAYARAVEAVPRAVGSSTPTGLIFQGFGLTLNPTGPTDAKVRVQSALGVAFDSNGRMLIKENGTQVDLTLSAGNSQLYAYFVETSSDTSVRRAISVAPPFTEGSLTLATKIVGGVGFFVRAGDQTSIVASDVVNGATTPLCFLGVASNSGGTVTMTGYDATVAPNGAFATNRITSVATPTTLPPANTANGSIATMHGLTNALAFMVGQALWKGSAVSPPNAANNFQAWSVHPTQSVATLAEYLAAGNLVGNHTISGSLSVGGRPLTFASTTFTPDFTTDLLAVTAHGLATGDGPFRLTTTGTLPTELLTATNYWVIFSDANHFKLAASLLNALGGLAIDFIDNGTGTHTISGNSPTHATDIAGSRNLSIPGTLSTGCAVNIGGQTVTLVSSAFIGNASLDELGVTGHGLQTGDGPLQVSNSGGALPVPLVAATNYWAIRDSVDKIKLSTTRERAINGIAIDLTTNGTGTNTIASVGATRAADATITGALRVEGGEYFTTRTFRMVASAGGPLNSTDTWFGENAGGIAGTPIFEWIFPLSVMDGWRITAIRGRVKDNVTGPTTISMGLTRSIDDTVVGIGGSAVVSAGTGAWQTLAKTGLTEVVLPGAAYIVGFATPSGTAANHIAWLEFDVDHLPA